MKIAVIGAGASGLMAAYQISKTGNVVCFDTNSNAGKKLLLTGSGRCNIGNVNNDLNKYHSCNNELISKIINEKNILMYKNVLENLGIVFKNKNGYLYPFSEKSISVLSVCKDACIDNNVEFRFNEKIEDIVKSNDKFIINGEIFDKVIIATGGQSYPRTGSDGFGYKIASLFGHKVNSLNPSLVPVITNCGYENEWAGIRTEVDVSLFQNEKFVKMEHGEIQFTNYGLSGICVFNLSRSIKEGLNKNNDEIISINFVPWCSNIKEYLNKFENKELSKICDGFLDYKITGIIIKILKLSGSKKWSLLNDKEKDEFCNSLCNFKVKIIDTKSFLDAQVTSGGVSLEEINLDNMESKVVSNLYFVGEVLDLDGDCGGYNLTISFITGLLAGGFND